MLGILETVTGVTKSLSVSLALLFGIIDVKQSFLVSNFEEIYQQEIEGFVK
jgi:chaperone required for assembly of F1-ATPase